MSTGDTPRHPAAPPSGDGEPPPPPAEDPSSGPVNATVQAILARQREEHTRTQRTTDLTRERERLWDELLLAPITPIRANWYAAWWEVAAAAHRDDHGAAVAALGRAADVFRRLREVVGLWRNAALEWRDHARSVDPGFGLLVPFRPANDTDLGYWAQLFGRENVVETNPPGRCRYDGPVVIPGHMNRQMPWTHPVAESGIQLLRLLAHAATADDLAEFVRTAGVGWLRGLTAALAAVILPPDAGMQFAAEELPADDDQRENARFLLGAARIGLGGDYLSCTRPLILGEATAGKTGSEARCEREHRGGEQDDQKELEPHDHGKPLDPEQCAHQLPAVTVNAIATRQAVAAPPRAGATPDEGQGGEGRTSAKTQTGVGKRTKGQKTKGQDINGKMLKMLQDNFEVVVEWGSQRWAQELGCDDSMVRKTKTWKKDLEKAREKLRRERAKRPPEEKRAG